MPGRRGTVSSTHRILFEPLMLLVTSSDISCTKIDNNACILLYTSCKESEDVWSHLFILASTFNCGSKKNKKSWNLGSDSWLWRDLHFLQTSSLLLVSSACSSKWVTSRGSKIDGGGGQWRARRRGPTEESLTIPLVSSLCL